MFDAARPVEMERVMGRAHIGLADGHVRELHQSGAAKVMVPQTFGPVEAVFLNTAGGITGGDRLRYSAETRGSACLTTQTAERAYRSNGGAGQVEVALKADGDLDWLPQETILFDQSALGRRLDVDLARESKFLFCEMLVFGRTAMGETVRQIDLRDRRVIRREGRVIFAEPLNVNSEVLADRTNPALMGGNIAFATVGLFCEGAQDRVDGVRQVLAAQDVAAEASGWDDKLVVRMMAGDGYPMRRAVAAVLKHLRGADLPRVWQI